MSARRFALLDPAAGISGDMLLGALIDVGCSPSWLRGLPARLGIADAEIEIADVMRCGMRSTKVTVRVAGATEGPADVFGHDDEPHHHHDGESHHHHGGDHSHHHHGGPSHHHHDSGSHHHHGGHHHHGPGGHPHRHVGELLAMIARADLSEGVKARSTAVFRRLAEAEGRIHGVAPDDVALHEVGAMDAVIDIVGAVEGFEQLGITEVYTRPVALGQGWVRAAHGAMPVPTPATAILVEGLAIAPNGPVRGEATTPTGAALLRTLVTGSLPERTWRPTAQGWGAGGRDPDGYANTLRLTIGEVLDEPAERLVVVATDLDDFSPEYLEPLRDALTGAGAIDVQTWPTQMKKGRIGHRIEALVPEDRADRVSDAFFRHSTTAGVRRWPIDRAVLGREQWTMIGPNGDPIRIKTVFAPDGPRVKPEFDDVVAVARKIGQPAHQLFRTIQEEALHTVRAAAPVAAPRASANPKES
ncbi:MAG: LarC family nickel insertion protein [Gemmatimonadetes bacterium]|nr:LarC family nickel insertion protein [Gemmatimonadota bacterium]